MKNGIPKMIGAIAVSAVVIGPAVARASNGNSTARQKIERALLPFISQFSRIRSIEFTAEISWSGIAETGPFAGRTFSTYGRYKFWASGLRYRIDWRRTGGTGAPIGDELWTFDGNLTESLLRNGSGGDLVVHKREPYGIMGPTESNPLFCSINGFCDRATKRFPGNWLNFQRAKLHPKAVATLPEDIHIIRFWRKNGLIFFTYHESGAYLRWPLKWPLKSKPPIYFHPGQLALTTVELRKLPNGVFAPHLVFSPPAVLSANGKIVAGARYQYMRFPMPRGANIYLPVEEIGQNAQGHPQVVMRITHIVVNRPVDPANFDINYDLASVIYEDGHYLPVRPRRPLPSQVRHLGAK